MTVSPGAIIANKYEVSGAPVRGGMGDVHPATRLSDRLPVAVKLLRDELRDLPDALERFRREAIAAERIHSEHVAQVLDVIEDAALGLVIVFEYLDGESLEDELKRERVMTLDRAHPVVCEILQGLADAHAVPVVHRDLKPANIFLQRTPDGGRRVKLVDFGISKILQESGSVVLTKAGQNLGSFSYMAPEQASAPSTVDQRADLYACGTVVFRMLTGQLPYLATSVGELIGKKARHPARKLAEALPAARASFSPQLEAWVGRLLERSPNARFANAWEALEAWEALAPGAGKTEGKVGQPMPAQPPAHRPVPAPAAPTPSHPGAPRPSQPPLRAAPPGGLARPPAAMPRPAEPAPPVSQALPRGPAPRVARAKTMLGMGPSGAVAQPPAAPPEEPRRPPSVPTRVERPASAVETHASGPRPAAGRPALGAAPRHDMAGRAAPVAPAGPPSMPRRPPPPPKPSYEDEEPDEDESPTAMFVHPSPMTYNPNGPLEADTVELPGPKPAAGSPPQAAAVPAAGAPPPAPPVASDDDEDYSEPPTAIHMPAFRPEEVPGAPRVPSEFRGPGAMPSPIGDPIPSAAMTAGVQPAAAGPAPAPAVQQPAAMGAFTPPGVTSQAVAPAPAAPQQAPAVAQPQPAQQVSYDFGPSASHPSRVAAMAPAYAPTPPPVDPDAAPLWLKAIALSTVVSALTVLAVLGWMVAHRF